MKEKLIVFSIMQVTGEHALVAARNMQEAFNYYMDNQTPGTKVNDVGICYMPEDVLKDSVIDCTFGKKVNALELLNQQTETCFLAIDDHTGIKTLS